MGTHRLISHPDTPPKAIEGVCVELERIPRGLWLRYTIDGPLEALALPEPKQPTRADGLWRTTCLEVFVRDGPVDAYREFNFSPSTEWAAYRFSAYREGMEELAIEAGPGIGLAASDNHMALEANVPLGSGERSLGLSAVIEELDGTKSYWALVHPPGQPDFHHRDCFALRLLAPDDT